MSRSGHIALALAVFSCASAPAFDCFASLRAYYEGRVSRTDDTGYAIDAPTMRLNPYEDSFAPVLGGTTIARWLQERRAAGGSTHVADIFGSGVFLNDLTNVDTMTGARLAPKVVPGLVPGYPNPKWQEVTGNLYARAGWNGLRANMRERGVPAYDLIVSRPVGPLTISFDQIRDPAYRRAYLTSHFNLVNRAWELLSPNDGMLLIEIPYRIAQTAEFRRWREALTRAGIEHDYSPLDILGNHAPRDEMDRETTSGPMILRRTPRSPARLPAY